MKGPTKAKALNLFASVQNTKYAIISREAESAIGCTRKSSASNHTVADCSNLVLYSTFYWQPAQIHKLGANMFAPGSLADKMSSTVHHMLNSVYKFLRDTS